LDSNEMDESDLQSEKHPEQRISTLRGISMDGSDEDEKADDSMILSRESDSNNNDDRDEQWAKHDEQRISTLQGITID
jgi:hypothetical protein